VQSIAYYSGVAEWPLTTTGHTIAERFGLV